MNISMKQYIILVLAVLISANVCAQNTQKLTATKVNEYGLIYTLPSTALEVTIETEKTVKEPGEFYQYSKKYLDIEPIKSQSQSWTVKSIAVRTCAQPDQDQRYLVQFKSGSSPFMRVDENNCPLSINTEDIPEIDPITLPEPKSAQPTVLQTAIAKQAVTAEMLQSPSSAKRAELAAARIYELRQSRSDIISGQADGMPSDGKAMQLALDNLSGQEAALTAMFTGTTQVSTDVVTYVVQLDSVDMSRVVVARLSAIDGLVDSDNLAGDPIYLDVKIIDRGKLPVNEKGEEKRFPKGGLAYRIPGIASVTTSFEGKIMSNDEVSVAQYGIVFGLDPNLFTDKKSPAYAIFDPCTGAIIEIGTK